MWRNFPPSFKDLLPPLPPHADLLTNSQWEQYWNDIHQNPTTIPTPLLRCLKQPTANTPLISPPTHSPPPTSLSPQPNSLHRPPGASKPSRTKSSHRNVDEKQFRKPKTILHKMQVSTQIQTQIHTTTLAPTSHPLHNQQCIQHTTDIQKPRHNHHLSAIPYTNHFQSQHQYIKHQPYNSPDKLFPTSPRLHTNMDIQTTSIHTSPHKTPNKTIAHTSASHAVKPHQTCKKNTRVTGRPTNTRRKSKTK
jgi:hypothetical protein